MRPFFVAIIAIVLTSCGAPPPELAMVQKPPTQWSLEDIAVVKKTRSVSLRPYEISFCSTIRAWNANWTEADRQIIRTELHRRNYLARDIEIITDPKTDWGTGMSYNGLMCSAGSTLQIKKSFDPGVGHRWQVQFGSSDVYLRGDGKPESMKVYAWN